MPAPLHICGHPGGRRTKQEAEGLERRQKDQRGGRRIRQVTEAEGLDRRQKDQTRGRRTRHEA